MRRIFACVILVFACVCGGCNENSVRRVGEVDASDTFAMRKLAISIIRGGLTDSDALIRASSIEIVTTSGRREFMPIVVKLLSDKSIPVRFAAAVAIGDMKYVPGQSALQKALRDKDENVKIAAAYGLTKITRTNFSKLIRNAVKSRDQAVRANAALLLGKLGWRENLKLLDSVINDPGTGDMASIQAVEALAMLDGEGIYQKLWTLLISKYADDRVMGIKAMGHLKSREAKNAIATMLMDDVPEVRLFAAEQLAKMSDPSGQEDIVDYLTVNSQGVQDRRMADKVVAKSIGYLRDESLVRFLPKLLNSPEKQVRLCAAQSVLLLAK